MKKINNLKINPNFINICKHICLCTAIASTLLSCSKPKNKVSKPNTSQVQQIEASDNNDIEAINNMDSKDYINNPRVVSIDITKDSISDKEISISNSEFEFSDELRNKFNNIINNFNDDCSFYVVNIKDGMSFGYNIDKSYATASTIKAAFSLYCFKQMDMGNGSLEELKLYEERFRRDGSSILKNRPSGVNYSLKDLFYYTINYSDNVAYNMIHDRFYRNSYNTFLGELGCSELYLKDGAKWGKINARSMALIWQEIYRYKDENENGKYLFELLTNAKYNYISEGITKYPSAHKSGWTPSETHDSGIVFADDDYIVITLNNNGHGDAKSQLVKICSCIEQGIDEYSIYKNNIKQNKQLKK